MDYANRKHDDAHMARAGQERSGKESAGFLEGGDERQLHDKDVEGTAENGMPDEREEDYPLGEYETLGDSQEDISAIAHFSLWSGRLPHPDDFNKYPADVQAKIVEMAEHSIAQNDSIVQNAIELDRRESERQDKYVQIDDQQIKRAQIGTICIYAGIIAVALFAIAAGQPTVACSALGLLGTVTVGQLVVSVRRRREVSHEASDRKNETRS